MTNFVILTMVPETVVEAVAETIAETVPAVTEIIEVAEATDLDYLSALVELTTMQTGFILFFVIAVLCYFGYKFFRIFF